MNILFYNLEWMAFNIFLAFVPVVLGQMMLKSRSFSIKAILGFFWLLFLPNTIYLLTDVAHFFEDIHRLGGIYLVIDFALYIPLIFIGISTFIFSLIPFEKMVLRKGKYPLFLLNFLVGFGLVLGRIYRLNSWDFFINNHKFLVNSFHALTSLEPLIMVVGFGLASNFIYFGFKKFSKTF